MFPLFEEDGPNDKEKIVYDSVVFVGTNHHLQDSLKPHTNYTVVVWAETGGGPGPKVLQKLRTYQIGS